MQKFIKINLLMTSIYFGLSLIEQGEVFNEKNLTWLILYLFLFHLHLNQLSRGIIIF